MWLWQFASVLQAVELQTMMGTTTALHQLCSGHGQMLLTLSQSFKKMGLPEPSWFNLTHSGEDRQADMAACYAARNSTHLQPILGLLRLEKVSKILKSNHHTGPLEIFLPQLQLSFNSQ